MTENETKAVCLYGMLPRDWDDFIKDAREVNRSALEILLLMLETPNAAHDRDTQEINKLGASIVRPIYESKNHD